MTASRILQDILTEFDERISSELNLDPLGLQVIWSAYGQKIFRNRISSISNDVRNYTLNLFNHAVTKALVEDDGAMLGKGLLKNKAYAGRGKDSTAFKQACLIYLENLFAYAIVDAQAMQGVETSGVLGISKARRRWEESAGNPRLLFSHEAQAHVLVRQNSLGVSGRYKTPLVEMKFFDSSYDYALPESRPQWQKAQALLFSASESLVELQKSVNAHMTELLADTRREPERSFAEVPAALKQAFVNAFRSPAVVGEYARDFWLAITELDQGAPGALYKVLKDEWLPGGQVQKLPTAEVFALAVKRQPLAAADREKLEHVCMLEPFLGELELLLGVMLSTKSQSLDEVLINWKALGRDGHTLPDSAARIEANAAMRAQVAGTAAERLDELLALARGTDVRQHMEQLLKYHDKVMEARGQSPWLRLLGGRQLKIDVRTRPLPEKDDRPVGAWVHQYYVPQFRHLLSGLRGLA
ncbi:hypothetical protein LQR30_08620 [Chromobacterium piscinae]|uniref:hypothetical protein n=1 Tax=Chromobacterium piscinae TaxID=686831 RepID=UPI001E56D1D0|nr:hypothetical protein [Chromobacterium piscinae]MCD4504166.1 hypothetical protein [Chromobacterium piscinae]